MSPRLRSWPRPPVLATLLACASAFDVAGCGLLAKAPRAEALLVVDTDLPVPKLAGTLRVDVFRASTAPSSWHGLEWIDTREFVLESHLDWPASLGVTIDDGTATERFVVRLRLYRSGKARWYHGERFLPPADEIASGPDAILLPAPAEEGEPPRLWRAGEDVTPAREPPPSLTVDKLVTFDLHAEERWQTPVLLQGDCAGIQTDLAGRRTCVDGTLVALADAARGESTTLLPRGASQEGRWPVLSGPRIPVDCDAPEVERLRHVETTNSGARLFDEEVCLPGGAFIFGDARWADRVPADDPATAGIGEERIAVVPRVFLDKYEYTVARTRRSKLAATLYKNDEPLDYSNPRANVKATCSYGTSTERDALPLNCVSAEQARTLCESEGREPSRLVVYQYAFRNGYLDVATDWPWSEPSRADPCSGAVLERADVYDSCRKRGPAPLGDADEHRTSPSDISVRGVFDLLGSLAEIQGDSALPFAARCWRSAPFVLPSCDQGGARWVAGGSWATDDNVHNRSIAGAAEAHSGNSAAGFRCMRRIDP